MYSRVKGPNKVSHTYMPGYHGRKARNWKDKTRFSITEDEEYELFNLADEHDVSPIYGQFDTTSGLDYVWINDNHCGLFSAKRILDGSVWKLSSIGENGERFAYFPAVTNMTDSWHGYPIRASNPEHPLGPKLMEYFKAIGLLSEIDVTRIKRKAL